MLNNKKLNTMTKLLLATLFSVSQLFSQYCHDESGWCFDQTTFQAFYFFHESEISFDYSEGFGPIEDGDVLGAFNQIDPDGVADSGDEYDV